MKKLHQKIKNKRIAIDTMWFIYHFEANEKYVSITKELFGMLANKECSGVTSLLTLAELLSPKVFSENRLLLETTKLKFKNIPNTSICNITEEIILTAAHLRSKLGIKLPDAIHLSTAVITKADIFLTNDENIVKCKIYGLNIYKPN
jgi:predicted nucleic acid-binding protein